MRALIAALLSGIALPALAEQCYAVDPAGGEVSFRIEQAGSPFSGAFGRFGGELCLAGDRVARVDVWLEPASVRTGLPEIDAALKGAEFFDVARHPRIAFASESVQPRGERQVARGSLEIKGKRRNAEVPFRLAESGGRHAVSGTFALDRLDYGIGAGEWSDTRWLGAEVKVQFRAGLSRK